ncbi:hypothetical protein LPJ59_001828 [Coemansia sp. RSA 2399]|nr:hypothetical protein LPJ59_001828 [Coemansia sp. RSA 2399]KAJ1906105.1 hypothetical protein LPJ81_001535 [Coemansia sp. IMI 209127]
MGFKKPKASKSKRNPLDEDDQAEQRNLEPSNIRSGGGRKVSKRQSKSTNDAPKSFQHLMQFMERKKQRDQEVAKNKKRETKGKAAGGNLKIMSGESMPEFERRVTQKMYSNLQLINKGEDPTVRSVIGNPSRDDGDEAVVSKRTDRKRRNDAIRKQRKLAKKHKDTDDLEDATKARKVVEEPKFGEQAQAPPIFRALPKEKIKKMVPLPNSKEEQTEKKLRDELAVKKMIQKTARLSPLEKMQAKRKAKEMGDTAADKRIMEAEREKAIRRYRMLRAVREGGLPAKS